MNSKNQKKIKKAVRQSIPLPETDLHQKLIRILALIVATVALIQYIQTFTHGFALDDYSAILENKVTQGGIQAIPTIFNTTYRFGYPIQGDELYRPIPKSVFAILWQLAPNNPLPGHLLNIILYAITGILLFITLAKFLPQNIHVAFFSAIFFTAHPVHTEVVANIKSMDEMLSFLFFLISLLCLHQYFGSQKKRWVFFSVVSYFASLLSKESAITYLAVFPLIIFYFTKIPAAKNFRISMLMLIPALIFLIIRYRIVGETVLPGMADNALFASNDELVRKASAVCFLGIYLRLLIIPSALSFDYSYNQIPLCSLMDIQFWIAAGAYLALLIFSIVYLKKKNLIAFGILFFLITISISSNLIIYIGTHMAERLLYVPSLGFCFSLAAALGYFIKDKKSIPSDSLKLFFQNRVVLTGLASAVTFFYTLKTWSQNPVWRNNETLYESGIVQSPKSHRTHFYLGNFLLKKKYYSGFPANQQKQIIQRGLGELRKSIAIYPEFADAWLHIGNYYSEIHQEDSAEYYFIKTLEIEPFLAVAHNNLGTVYFGQKKYGEAISEFISAIQNDPNYHDGYRNLGSVYGTIGKYQESIKYFNRALQIAPEDAETNYYLGITYRNLGDMLNARVFLDRAAALDPQFRNQ
ncbi:MAG: tetratricopeptide repeat protein [Chitinophagales bacterium]